MSRRKYQHDRAKYEAIISGGQVLEAVFRIQTAATKKQCAADYCGLDRDIKVYTDYVRVYFPDEDTVEFFHYGCFRREFKPDDKKCDLYHGPGGCSDPNCPTRN